MNNIPLRNGKVAIYRETRAISASSMESNHPADEVHVYDVPCLLCNAPNPAYSYDGLAFASFQVVCRYCGIYFRPVVDPSHLAQVSPDELAINRRQQEP